jgi:DNA-binding PadR family transcriptional regulator
MQQDLIRGHLDSLILAVLSAGPAHGYAIIKALRERSAGELDLPEGTVYPALQRLERTGLIASSWSQEQGRPRRTYRIGAIGLKSLERKRADWRRFAAAVDAVMGGGKVVAHG